MGCYGHDSELAALVVTHLPYNQFECVSVCFQVFSSLSLDLLPERAATLMVYEDVVQIVSGYQGKSYAHAFFSTDSLLIQND